jgi:hypothetical protein
LFGALKLREKCVTEVLSAFLAKDVLVDAVCNASAVFAKVMGSCIVDLADFLFGVVLLAKANPNLLGVVKHLIEGKLDDAFFAYCKNSVRFHFVTLRI